jgi:phosphoglycolate phosphatase
MDVAYERAVYVGDSEIDVAAARAARLPVVLVRYGYCRVPLESLQPDAAIDRFDELPAALNRLSGGG